MTYINLDLVDKNPQAVITTNSSGQTTSASANTYVTINGSEITYTPVAGSNKVIYEIGFYVQGLNKASFQHFVLEENTGSSWSIVDNKFGKNIGADASSQNVRDYIYYRFIIPSWSGSRQLRLQVAGHVSNREMTYHQMTDWDGSGSITNKFCNTSLLVYSI
tara:strand:+ start:1037 stop:1522 length:486 start_codon:yes stop_codon:yes gene_type:complete